MTISHPAKVNIGSENILASGVDSLVLSLNVVWNNTSLFSYLDKIKEDAKNYGSDLPGQLKHLDATFWPFVIKPHGTKGFSWIISSSDFTYKIGNWTDPGPRPSAMVEIRSETLWRLGSEDSVKIALSILQANQGQIIEAKLSRVDLCVDVLMPEEAWSSDLMEYAVTRASDYAPYYRFKILTGIRIGKGNMSARLYDKPLEIKQQSGKTWMFDIWGIKVVPEGQKIIRIEFQIRREALKDLGLNTINDLSVRTPGAWLYCSQKWLKFQDRPGMHHNQRSTLKWWEEVQNGFKGVQGAEPLVRVKAVRADKKRLMQQMNGCAVSLHAIKLEEQAADLKKPVSIQDYVLSYVEELEKDSEHLPDFQPRLEKKRAKYHREKPTTEEGQRLHRIGQNER